MTQQEAKLLLENPIFRAYTDGKTIQFRNKEYSKYGWEDIVDIQENVFIRWATGNTSSDIEYRIKPEPRTWWLVIYPYCGNTAKQMFDTKGGAEAFIAANNHANVKMELVEVKEVL